MGVLYKVSQNIGFLENDIPSCCMKALYCLIGNTHVLIQVYQIHIVWLNRDKHWRNLANVYKLLLRKPVDVRPIIVWMTLAFKYSSPNIGCPTS